MDKKVLIVDDAAFMRMMIKNILVEDGFEIAGEAENGKEAIELYKELEPDLVTMDITMPDMDGIEAVKEILKIDKDARVIMCSAMGQQAMVIDAIQAGAKDFVVKPFKPDRVLSAIRKIFNEL
ncbi:response regulator [Iocasia frigidifontis]|uniref:Stage 0 sporulation protein A homolog n=1 Tax=Iocasia fonsfrigidae TaxID=2682810 RepID=A0A8A7K9E6_9FIRM|nr:response regulator [Iocasia fonsfrigidae]QTL98433.1 response regulator [Iocasia fonsfrigidae]